MSRTAMHAPTRFAAATGAPFHRLRPALGAAALALAAALTGCAVHGPAGGASAPPPGMGADAVPLIAVPPSNVGAWRELGYFLAPWMAGDAPAPVAGPSVPTRVAGLRRDDGQWLAIVLVQTAPAGSAPCPAPTSLHVASSRLGDDDCLRMRGDADFDHWLEQQHSVLYHWLEGRGWGARPRGWIGYRARVGGSAVEVHVLADPALLEPATRNNSDFLAGGQSAQRWAQRLVAATRAAGGGTLNVPPFPFAPQIAPPASAPASVQIPSPRLPAQTPGGSRP